VDDWTDARFRFWTVWDASNIYVFVKVWDDKKVLVANSGNVWESDGIELFFDGNNSKGQTYDGVNDNQIRFERRDAASADVDLSLWFDKSLIHFANKETTEGWNLELSIPMSALKINPAEKTKFGFEIQMNDNDTGTRDVLRRWWNWNDATWSNPSLMGTAELVASGGRVSSTVVGEKAVEKVAEYRLAQNYPNPFNPSTTISFDISEKTFVSLKVYDVHGREMATLVNEELSAGSHLRRWDAVSMRSGVYFYRLQAGIFTETRKLILLK
jgi:hypothetical protein